METNSPPDQPSPSLVGPATVASPLRIGQVYLEPDKRRLHFLNEAAVQLRAEGIPFTKGDLASRVLRDAEGPITHISRLPLLQAWRAGKPIETTFVLYREGQPPATVCWSAVPHKDANGNIAGIFGSVCYVPAEPDWKGLAGLAHDFRTPLHALNLLTDALETTDLSTSSLQDNLADLRASISRALQVGGELLELCRGAAKADHGIKCSWFALEPFLSQLAREQTFAAERKALRLSYDGAATSGWEAYTDPVRLGRLLSNLLVNAVRYTASGKVAFTASWRHEPTGSTLVLSVVDTGIGISEQEQESIFEHFERGQAGKEDDSGGSGLGLAIVDRLVEELELDLEVYSEFGRGSAFHLLIPWRLLRSTSSAITTPMASTDTHPDLEQPSL